MSRGGSAAGRSMGAHTLASGLLRFARNDGASVVVKNALVKAIFRLMRLRISQLRRGVTANPARQVLCEIRYAFAICVSLFPRTGGAGRSAGLG